MFGEDLVCLILPVARVEDDHRAPTFNFLLNVDEARIQELLKGDCGVFRATEGGQDGTAGAEPADVNLRKLVVHSVSIACPHRGL